MIDRVPSLEKLVQELGRLPGIGTKTAQRLAYYILRAPEDYTESLRERLLEVKRNIRECSCCHSYTENESVCHYCSDESRRKDLICVVEDPSDITRIESSQVFRGVYHVLHGSLSPLEGIGPQDLRILSLLQKIQKSSEEGFPVQEVILALDADLEGDTTALYLAKLLGDVGVKVSRIAHGVPFGSDIDYIDHRTLGRALENRIQM